MNRIQLTSIAMALFFCHSGFAEDTARPIDLSSKYLVSEADAIELSYSGQVIDKRTRKPIANATVTVRRKRSNYFDLSVIEETTHQTDSEGIYHFSIPPEQAKQILLYVELDVQHPDYASQDGVGYSLDMIRKNERLGDRPFFKRIELHPAAYITGRLIGPDGQPVSGVDIQSYSKADPDNWKNNFGSWFHTQSDDQGRFRLRLIQDGDSVFWIVPSNFSPIPIVSGYQRGDLGDIQLATGVSVSGQILNTAGLPVSGAWVNLVDEAGSESKMPVASSIIRSSITDRDGKFSLSPTKAGIYRISVDETPHELKFQLKEPKPTKLNDVFIPRSIELDPVQVNSSITIQASPQVEFRAQIYGSNGERRPGYWIHIMGKLDNEWYSRQITPNQDGAIAGKLPLGLREAKLMATDNEHHAVQIRLKKDAPLLDGNEQNLGDIERDVLDVEIYRYESPIVLLKPVDETGQIVKDCSVAVEYTKDNLKPPANGIPRPLSCDHQQDGRFRSRSILPEREVTFTVEAAGYGAGVEKIRLPEGMEREVTVVLKKLSR